MTTDPALKTELENEEPVGFLEVPPPDDGSPHTWTGEAKLFYRRWMFWPLLLCGPALFLLVRPHMETSLFVWIFFCWACGCCIPIMLLGDPYPRDILGLTLHSPVRWNVLKQAEDSARIAGLLVDSKQNGQMLPFVEIADKDPALALTGLRMQLERRIKELAICNNIQSTGLADMLSDLRAKHILTPEQYHALNKLRKVCNDATHLEPVEDSASVWVRDVGPRLIAGMDLLLAHKKPKNGS